MTLELGEGLQLSDQAVTGTYGILATKGAGKSNAAVVMGEKMWKAGVTWVAVDPKGDWWGIRSDASGKGPGLPIIVFGGRHGDLPLESTAGALIASLVLERRITCVLDVSQFSKAETTRFLLAFGSYLYEHADDGDVEPLHLFLEEAHEYLPQVVKGDQAALVGIWQRIVKQGRFKGLGVTMISQRSAVLNKDVLELIDTLIVLRTMGPLSRKAIAGWVQGQDVDPDLLATLPSLADGEAWIWSPGVLKLSQRFRFHRRSTFDSGATPEVGKVRRAPTTIADVDLGALREAMAETIERAEADDPKAQRRRIAELESALRSAQRAVHTVQVPVVAEETLLRLEALVAPVVELAAEIGERLASASVVGDVATVPAVREPMPPPPAVAPPPATRTRNPESGTRDPGPGRNAQRPRGSAPDRVLAAIAQYHPQAVPVARVAMLAGLSPKKSTLRNALSQLRQAGLIEGSQELSLTDDGLGEVGDVEPLPTGEALLAHWVDQLSPTEREAFLAFYDSYPDELSLQDVAERIGRDPGKSTIRNAVSRLRTLGLVDGNRLADALNDAIETTKQPKHRRRTQ